MKYPLHIFLLVCILSVGGTSSSVEERRIYDLLNGIIRGLNMTAPPKKLLAPCLINLETYYPNITNSLSELPKIKKLNLEKALEQGQNIYSIVQLLSTEIKGCITPEMENTLHIINQINSLSFSGLLTRCIFLPGDSLKEQFEGMLATPNDYGQIGFRFGSIIRIVLFDDIYPTLQGSFNNGAEVLGVQDAFSMPTGCEGAKLLMVAIREIAYGFVSLQYTEIAEIQEKMFTLFGLMGEFLLDTSECATTEVLMLYRDIRGINWGNVIEIMKNSISEKGSKYWEAMTGWASKESLKKMGSGVGDYFKELNQASGKVDWKGKWNGMVDFIKTGAEGMKREVGGLMGKGNKTSSD